MRIENGKLYASRKVAHFWRPILQPIVDCIGGFLEHRGGTAVLFAVAIVLWGVGW